MRWLVLRETEAGLEVEKFATEQGAVSFVADCLAQGTRDRFEVYERTDRVEATAQLLEAVDALVVDVDSFRARLEAVKRARAILAADDEET